MLFKKFKLLTIQCLSCTNKGFTLAEVMVVLGILGILAALLIPAIMQTAPDNNRIMFKKSYSVLEEAINQMINDNDDYPDMRNTALSLSRGFNYVDTTLGSGLNKFCYVLSQKLNTVDTVSCPAVGGTGNGTFTTTDGVSWTVYIPVSDTITISHGNSLDANTNVVQFPLSPTLYTTKIIFDVNGSSKTPNCSADSSFAAPYIPSPAYSSCISSDTVNDPCQKKPDTFIIGIRYDGKLQIGAGAGSGSGTDACANFIINNPTQNN